MKIVDTSIPSSGKSAVGFAVGLRLGDPDGDFEGETCDSVEKFK